MLVCLGRGGCQRKNIILDFRVCVCLFVFGAQIDIFNCKKKLKKKQTQPPRVNQHNLRGNQEIMPHLRSNLSSDL